jgi:glutamate/tyrosine decarboxylase-like PLP-dependent enzyme
MRELLNAAAERAMRYLDGLNERGVAPDRAIVARLAELDIPLPDHSSPVDETIALLDSYGAATMAMAGPRFFGFVVGGALPAALAANWLASSWDQMAGLAEVTPLPAKLEEVALRWLRDVLGLPPETGVGFVTGATMANFTCLAAARHTVLKQAGWDVEADGMFGAPEVAVVVGEEAHVSLFKSLGLAGFGRNRVVRVPVDKQGRMRAEMFPNLSGPTIVCLQAGNVNSGAFDPAPEIIPKARAANAWVHVDGAFGLWAGAAPSKAHLMAGYAGADSWATDAHKYLNTPYDSGLAFVAIQMCCRPQWRFPRHTCPQAQHATRQTSRLKCRAGHAVSKSGQRCTLWGGQVSPISLNAPVAMLRALQKAYAPRGTAF